MNVLLGFFLGAAALLWLSVFGYPLVLRAIVLARRKDSTAPAPTPIDYPRIAILLPALNEESLILTKLEDLRRADYPRDLVSIVVADGGSSDRTVALVQEEIQRGEPIQLAQVEGARGQANQINLALAQIEQEIVVVTDVDAALAPSCIRRLVEMLMRDPQTAVVGATVDPASDLAEEHAHRWLLNRLWWLEGEALSAAVVAGACYALRRSAVLPLNRDAELSDVHLAMTAGARGHRVRICREAHATEVRAPRSWQEVVQFRHRRGLSYRAELLRRPMPGHPPVGYRVARLIRLWHFFVTPKLVVGVGVAALVLLATAQRRWPLLALVAYVAPAAVGLLAADAPGGWSQRWRLCLAAGRLVGLTWLSLLGMNGRGKKGNGLLSRLSTGG